MAILSRQTTFLKVRQKKQQKKAFFSKNFFSNLGKQILGEKKRNFKQAKDYLFSKSKKTTQKRPFFPKSNLEIIWENKFWGKKRNLTKANDYLFSKSKKTIQKRPFFHKK